jgi:hypothetical protein
VVERMVLVRVAAVFVSSVIVVMHILLIGMTMMKGV